MDKAPHNLPYMDPDLPVLERSKDLIKRMTLAEKVGQLLADSLAVDRLGIPAYHWWNEAHHGVARAGKATVYPQAIGIAATWNEELVYRMANAISDEARAKYHEVLQKGASRDYQGITFFSPNINIFRDPRWGRGQETYGEDPYLTSRLGVQFVRGMQGDDPHYLKTTACAKHFFAHSGPEAARHRFDAQVCRRDMAQTYLPAFEALVKEGKVAGVMGAYNRVNGDAICASPSLLDGILRQVWGFEGFVVSDCDAIRDLFEGHHLVEGFPEAAAQAVRAGCNLNLGDTYEYLLAAVGRGLLAEKDIDAALQVLLNIRFRLGMFDPPGHVPYAHIPPEAVDSPASQALALEVARQSIVLLKNDGGLLPLDKNLDSIAVIGPNAVDTQVLLGNYHGTPTSAVSVLDGIRNLVPPSTKVSYAAGCDLLASGTGDFTEAHNLAEKADVVVMVMGLSQQVEGEEGQTEGNLEGVVSRGDRERLDLPGEQEALLKAIAALGKPMVLVLLNGSALAINWADEHIPAILEAWYPGQAGGRAVAEVLFGDYNPGGRLPITFYRSHEDLPPFEDYNMAGRTYRYFEGDVLYPFGYGLSYTQFWYHNLALNRSQIFGPEVIYLSCDVENVGSRSGDEVVQVYLRDEESAFPVPHHSLVGFKRIRLAPGARERVNFEIHPRQMAVINDDGQWLLEPGWFSLFVGGGQPGTKECLSTRFEFWGSPQVLG